MDVVLLLQVSRGVSSHLSFTEGGGSDFYLDVRRPGLSRDSSAIIGFRVAGELASRASSASRTTSLLFKRCPCLASVDRSNSIRSESSDDRENVTRIG